MPRVQTHDDVSIAYQVRGDGPRTLLFVHGWAGSGRYFEPTVDALDLTGLRVVTFDLRGHGSSGPASNGFEHETLARDAFAVADAIGADNVVGVGFSMGARFVQYLPVLEPERVEGQILIAGCPAAEVPMPAEVLDEWYGWQGDAQKFIAGIAAYTHVPIDDALWQRFGEDAAKVPLPALKGSMELCTSASFLEDLQKVPSPTLVIGGAHDPIFTPDVLRGGVVAPLRAARLALVDAGHEIPIERPRELAALIEAFVAGLGVS